MNTKELKSFLDQKAAQYHHPNFIESDPIQIPHQFSKKEDIEISGFLTATIAWGNRTMIIKNARQLMERLDHSPFDFVMHHSKKELKQLEGFVHRTFNDLDAQYFVLALQHMYSNYGGLETILLPKESENTYQNAISDFKKVFFELEHPSRTEKHISDPNKNSAAKRINMYLRWMVREDSAGVDFGLWKRHDAKKLSCPLDVHSGSIARKLGVLKRKQNDWKAVMELDTMLRKFNPNDPVLYDYALFGLGVFEKF